MSNSAIFKKDSVEARLTIAKKALMVLGQDIAYTSVVNIGSCLIKHNKNHVAGGYNHPTRITVVSGSGKGAGN